jgi:protein SCO1/2
MKRKFAIFPVLLLLVLLFGAAFLYLFPLKTRFHGTPIDPPKPMGDFTLSSGNGPVSLRDFRGKYIILSFGYTSCPDICPTTLAYFRQALDNLGKDANQVQVIFVSVDWKRDTPEKTSAYMNHFGPEFIGLGGSQEQIDAVTKEFDIFYLLGIPDSVSNFYTVDHTATVQILDREGNLVLTWPFGFTPSDYSDDLKMLLKN